MVDMTWDDNVLTHAIILSKLGGTCKVRAAAPLTVTCDGENVSVNHPTPTETIFETQAGKTYTLV